ncbi:MAG: EutN/CcmL family microcompartment protein [Bryobacterales bacterium]|nr:EutN/CcmL family microcompartment protein [Bryobacteraceae bacterium]MDW8131499.1 EutN/CcmL family microcompartment protein [Bryobacterales bacterium]
MYLGRVVGRVWATVKNANLTGHRLLIVQPVTPELQDKGRPIVCTDWTGAGAGELIYWTRAREASFAFLPAEVVTDATIVGIVDAIRVNRKRRREGDERSGEC